jgi:hypothetical protein
VALWAEATVHPIERGSCLQHEVGADPGCRGGPRRDSAASAEGGAPPKVRPWRRSRPAPPGPRSRPTGGDRWSDGEAEDQRRHEDERRHPDEKGALSCLGSERVQLVSFTFHFSFTFHCITDTPKGDVGI